MTGYISYVVSTYVAPASYAPADALPLLALLHMPLLHPMRPLQATQHQNTQLLPMRTVPQPAMAQQGLLSSSASACGPRAGWRPFTGYANVGAFDPFSLLE